MSQNSEDNFYLALQSLQNCFSTPIEDDRDRAGIIQNFEFTYEASWKVLRHVLDEEGIGANTPREVFAKAYQAALIQNEGLYLQMMKDRNLTVHTYDEATANEVYQTIKTHYFSLLNDFYTLMKEK